MTFRPLKIVTWNCSTLQSRQGELINFLNSSNTDIMILNETKLKPEIKFQIKGYQIYRKDRPIIHYAAGGIAAIIKTNIPHQCIDTPDTSLETLCIRLLDNTHIIAAYNQPLNTFTQQELHTLLNISHKVILMGDLNAVHQAWNNNRNNANGRTLYTYIQAHNAQLLYTPSHTHYPQNGTTPTTIDICIYKNILHISDIENMDILSSDHTPVTVTLNNQYTEEHTRTLTSYKHTDWSAFRKELNTHIIINNQINTTQDIDTEIQKLTDIINTLKHKHTKQIIINTNRDPFPQHITQLITRRNNIRKHWQRTQNLQYREQMKELNKEIRKEISNWSNEKWQNKLNSLNTKDYSLWKFTKSLKRKNIYIPTLTHNNSTYFTDEEKANAIGEIFEQVHVLDAHTDTQHFEHVTQTVHNYINTPHITDKKILHTYYTTPTKLKTIIKKLTTNKAPGPDLIENKIIKSLPRKTIVQLTYIINSIIRLNYFPDNWKTATIIPILKPNKNIHHPTSFRPISLLNSISKLTERVIFDNLLKFTVSNNILPDHQFGFRQQRSTTQQLARILNDAIYNFNKNKVTVMCLLDIEKAFDKVWTDGLLYKLIQLNYPVDLIILLNSYLKNRKFQVKINNTFSTLKNIKAGVPQGSILAPLLFIIYLHDLPTFAKTETALFADDTAIYTHSHSAEVAGRQIQFHINILEKYWRKWQIKINCDKTEVIIITRKFTNIKIYTPIKIHGEKIHVKDTAKYLGINLDKRLNLHNHINTLIQKLHYSLKQNYSLLSKRSTLTSKTKKHIYTALIRPVITYSAPILAHLSDTTIKPLQVFQNKILRLVTGHDRYTRITTLHELTNTPYIRDYITQIANKFYTKQSYNTDGNIIKNISKFRADSRDFKIKHKFTYQLLDIFNEPFEEEEEE